MTLPSGITILEDMVFCYCTSLTSFIIPEGVVDIQESAVNVCTGLTTITYPRVWKRLAGEVFI